LWINNSSKSSYAYLIGAPDEQLGLSPMQTAYSLIVIFSKLTDEEDLVDPLPEEISNSSLFCDHVLLHFDAFNIPLISFLIILSSICNVCGDKG
jgi:hypothetical protein